MSKTAQLHYKGKIYTLPIIEGTENEKAIDIGTLRSMSGLITLDIGLKNTGSTQSTITFLDGEKGILRYRGYAIEGLAERATFLEIAYLLLYGKLPTETDFKSFSKKINTHTLMHKDMHKMLNGFPTTAHPMGILSSLVCSLTTFYPESLDTTFSPENIDLISTQLIAKLPIIVAWIYKHKQQCSLSYHPRSNLDYCSNFLHMMFSLPSKEYIATPVVSEALSRLLILHADHEQNCSTATVRITGSSQSNLYSSIAAGINALWGRLHGGANQAVIEMLERIQNDKGNVKKYIDKAKDKNDPFRLMGFGHRVYKNLDPRAKIIKQSCDQILKKIGTDDPMFDTAKKLEEIALKDEYFIQRKLYPNVDFYSGIIYKAIGIPTDMFTVMFALGRLPGWIAQWKEMKQQGHPISRPRQIYTGPNYRVYEKGTA